MNHSEWIIANDLSEQQKKDDFFDWDFYKRINFYFESQLRKHVEWIKKSFYQDAFQCLL